MFQKTQDFVPSPCINVCQLDRSGRYCRGCFRSLDEIAAWSRASNDEKRTIVARPSGGAMNRSVRAMTYPKPTIPASASPYERPGYRLLHRLRPPAVAGRQSGIVAAEVHLALPPRHCGQPVRSRFARAALNVTDADGNHQAIRPSRSRSQAFLLLLDLFQRQSERQFLIQRAGSAVSSGRRPLRFRRIALSCCLASASTELGCLLVAAVHRTVDLNSMATVLPPQTSAWFRR